MFKKGKQENANIPKTPPVQKKKNRSITESFRLSLRTKKKHRDRSDSGESGVVDLKGFEDHVIFFRLPLYITVGFVPSFPLQNRTERFP
jgi:hypothetical protein